jgi:hypothetical protein
MIRLILGLWNPGGLDRSRFAASPPLARNGFATFFPGAVPAPSSRDKKPGSGRPPLRSGLAVHAVRPAA